MLSQCWQASGPLNAGLKKYLIQKILRHVSYRLPCNNYYELKAPTEVYHLQDLTSTYTTEISPKIIRPAFSGPVFKEKNFCVVRFFELQCVVS